MAKKISRSSLKEKVQEELLRRIIDGHYSPGQRLMENALAEEFGVSPIPVREALRELSVMRVVDFEAYKGVRVRTFSNAEIRDAYEVRAVLEDSAAQRAARFFKGNAKSLYHFLEQMKKTASEGDVKGYLNYDLPLHRAIVAAAGNEHLLRAWDSLGFEIRAYLFLTRDNRDLPKIAEEHLPMVKALESGDGRKAGALLRRHCLTFAKEVMALESPPSSPQKERGRRAKVIRT
jgi:DNA-binding GntR family transcriptional regulator